MYAAKGIIQSWIAAQQQKCSSRMRCSRLVVSRCPREKSSPAMRPFVIFWPLVVVVIIIIIITSRIQNQHKLIYGGILCCCTLKVSDKVFAESQFLWICAGVNLLRCCWLIVECTHDFKWFKGRKCFFSAVYHDTPKVANISTSWQCKVHILIGQ